MSLKALSETELVSPGLVRAEAQATLSRAIDRMRAIQSPEGWWKGELETNVTMDAEDLLLRQFLGIREAGETERAAKWIRAHQREDGSWALFHDGPADLSTTIEGYVALRLAGDEPDAPHMARAAQLVRKLGGIESSRVFTRVWLALFGEWDWDRLPTMPSELMLMPKWAPLNVYAFACWARQTIVPMTIVFHHRPVRSLGFGLEELHVKDAPPPPSPSTWRGRALDRLDRALPYYERVVPKWVRRMTLHSAERWIIQRQEADGSWGGIQPPWVYSLIALHLQGYALDHPVMKAGFDGLDRFTIDDERGRRLEACQSPVWDTALGAVALAEAGVAPHEPMLTAAGEWLLNEQVCVQGDWSVQRPTLEPGGWSFEFGNDFYPDVDDTAEVLLALHHCGHPDRDRVDRAIARGIRWMEGMQDPNGGFAAFDVGNTSRLAGELPFCDFGEVIDPPSADVTAHALEALAVLGRADTPAARDAVRWLSSEQEADGSWFGRWGVNYVYGTGAVVPALIAAGVRTDDLRIRRAVRWLEQHQNEDGGWGEDVRSYREPEWIGRGESTASQTAWALLALHAAGAAGPATDRALQWLSRTQRPDGSWDEPHYTGTGFPSDFSINYHLYRLIFPVMALGRLTR